MDRTEMMNRRAANASAKLTALMDRLDDAQEWSQEAYAEAGAEAIGFGWDRADAHRVGHEACAPADALVVSLGRKVDLICDFLEGDAPAAPSAPEPDAVPF